MLRVIVLRPSVRARDPRFPQLLAESCEDCENHAALTDGRRTITRGIEFSYPARVWRSNSEKCLVVGRKTEHLAQARNCSSPRSRIASGAGRINGVVLASRV